MPALRVEMLTVSDLFDRHDCGVLRESLNEGNSDRYLVVVLDEAHGRYLSTDVLIGPLRKGTLIIYTCTDPLTTVFSSVAPET
jgi:hypothetical protein